MAQNTGTDGLLAAAVRTTSARLCLALVVAGGVGALLIGCGGGTSDPGNSATASEGADAQDPATQASKEAEHGSGSVASGSDAIGSDNQSGTSNGSGSGSEGSGSGKHGAQIAQPKGSRERAATPEEIAHATVADMSLQSPAIEASADGVGHLATAYTCEGKGGWPELRWSSVPEDSKELALFVMNVAPVNEQLFVDWAVAGLDPNTEGIEAGHLPKGAVVGTNGFGKQGYEICPADSGETYMLALYALPKSLSPAKGFDARGFRKEVLAVSGDVGLLPVAYARGQ